jgi:hypothetical protein
VNAADAVNEIVRLVSGATVHDRVTGLTREAGAADIAILFRSRDSHRDFEAALDRRGVSTYVYKGLGFFDADEIQDAVALLRYLADPLSDLRAATLLRSRIVRLSDAAVARLGKMSADAILSADPRPELGLVGDEDRRVLESCAPRCRVGCRGSIAGRRRSRRRGAARDRLCLRAARLAAGAWRTKKLRHDPAGAEPRVCDGSHRRSPERPPWATSRTRRSTRSMPSADDCPRRPRPGSPGSCSSSIWPRTGGIRAPIR